MSLASDVHTAWCSCHDLMPWGWHSPAPVVARLPGALLVARGCLCAGTSDVGGMGQGSESQWEQSKAEDGPAGCEGEGVHFEGVLGFGPRAAHPGLWLRVGSVGPWVHPAGALHDLGGKACGSVGSPPGWPSEAPPSARVAIFPTA